MTEEPRFVLDKSKSDRFTTGCTTLIFRKDWNIEPIHFNDEEFEELRQVITAGNGDCDHCDPVLPHIFLTDRMRALEKEVEELNLFRAEESAEIKQRVFALEIANRDALSAHTTRGLLINDLLHQVKALEKTVNTSPLYDLCKRVRKVEWMVGEHLKGKFCSTCPKIDDKRSHR